MKLNLRIFTLVGLVACTLAALAQTNPPAEAPAAAAPASPADAAANPATVSPPGAVIPLIVMDDVPLTDAIRNLARQANLNYMLDPKIGYGQPGADGKVTPSPRCPFAGRTSRRSRRSTPCSTIIICSLMRIPKAESPKSLLKTRRRSSR